MNIKTTARRTVGTLAAAGLAAIAIASGPANGSVDARTNATTVVSTDKGQIEGTVVKGVRTWLGIPYAQPPIDELRWRSPQPVDDWDGVRNATKFASPCAQIKGFIPGVPSKSEDCLNLNVYAPKHASADLPVMVWFHGGGNTYGAAQQYDPTRLVADGDVIVVTVNYRQGVFANLSHTALDEKDGEVLSGNYGLEDQQAALRWVQANSDAFGGDVDNVTIFGQSGSGYDICTHLTSPSAEGLFDKAIIQSSPCTTDWAPSREEGQAQSKQIAKAVGCDSGADVAECLRRADVTELMTAASPEGGEFQPVVGGPILQTPTAEALAADKINATVVMQGINRDEMQTAPAQTEMQTGKPLTEKAYLAMLDRQYGDDADAVAAEYPVSDYDNPTKAMGAVMTDQEWALNSAATSELLADRVPTFTYELGELDTPWFADYPELSWPVDSQHMAELAYIFDSPLFEERNATQDEFADSMVDIWTTFAHNGDPDGEGEWAPATDGRHARQLSSNGAANVDVEKEHHLEFWRGL